MFDRIKALLDRLAILPIHSTEWLQNPSVRLDIGAAVVEARSILEQLDVKFCVVEINDGGATEFTLDREGVCEYLGKPDFDTWREALTKFEATAWAPGLSMAFPCGWIFAVWGDAEL